MGKGGVMDIQNFISEFKKTFVYDMLKDYVSDEKLFDHVVEGAKVIWMKEQTRQMWSMWQAAKASVAEGFVLVEKSKLKTWYQDDDEPENWANNIDELDVLGDGVDEDEFICVNQITEVIIQTVKKFGVWKVEMIDQWGDVHRNFVLADSQEDAQKVIESNKFIHAHYEAQEQVG